MFLGDKLTSHNYPNSPTPSKEWTIDTLFANGPFSVVILTLWFWNPLSIPEQYLDDIRRLAPGSRVLCMADDCHGRRASLAAQYSGRFSDEECALDVHEREVNILRQCDGVIVVSPLDGTSFAEDISDLDIYAIGFSANVVPDSKDFHSRHGLLFLGDYHNPATVDSAKWIVNELWPTVSARLPQCSLTLAGSGSERLLPAEGKGVCIIGQVNDLHSLFSTKRVFVSPVLYGTGVSTKNVHAMASGLALVTTSIGAAPLGLSHGEEAYITDSATTQAEYIMYLHESEREWTKVSRRAREYVLANFSEHAVTDATQHMLDCLGHPKRQDICSSTESHVDELRVMPLALESTLRYLCRRVTLGLECLRKGDGACALRHFRFALPWVELVDPGSPIHVSLVATMAEAYEQTGNHSRRDRCNTELIKVGIRLTHQAPMPSMREWKTILGT